jgi:hypothetical protein
MSEKRRAVDFPNLIRRMKEDELKPSEWPTVVGGECSEAELVDWLNGLDLSAMEVRIWESTDRCTIGDDGPPETAGWLERARIFGAGGDLDVRRDGDDFRWRYVGEADYAPEEEELLPYPGTPERPVYRRTREALLWGERKEGQPQWFDDRTAGADLSYPVEGAPARVQVHYWEYTQAGRTLAVWLRGLEEYDG